MKVLLVNKFHYKKGGSETYYFAVAEALEKKGHKVIFFSMKDENNNIPCEQEEYFVSNASVNGGLKSKWNMIMHIAYSKEAYKNMKSLLKKESPDLVILNLVHKQITLSIIDAIKEYNPKLPIFWTMHDLITVCPAYTMLDGNGNICEKCVNGNFQPCVANQCIKNSRIMSMLSKYEAEYIRKKKWYDQIDLFICPSEFYKKKLMKANFTKRRMVVLRNPLPIGTEYSTNISNKGYVLYFGRLAKEKGVKVLIDAVKILKCKLIILGTGPIEKELQEYAKKEAYIEFKGFQTGQALKDFIKNSFCVVLPSEWYENGPYSAMEAMALGKPLIVSDKGGLPELVEDGKNGFVYDGTIPELADAIRKVLMLGKEEYEDMSKYSLKKAKEYFDPDEYIEQIEKWFEIVGQEKQYG